MTLLVSLIIVGISTVTAILIDRFVAKKNIQNDSKIFNQEKTMIDEEYRYSVNENKEIIETTSSSNSNSQIEYYKGVKKSILAFVIYYAFNIGGGLVFQFILHPFVLKDLGITIEQLIETSQYYDEAAYKMYESYLTGYLNFVVFAVIFVGLILLYKKSLLQNLKELKAKPFQILKLAGLGFVGMYVANFFVSVIVMLFFGDDFVSTNQNSLIDLFNAGGDIRILLVIFTVIFAPIVEELLFRKSLFNFFKKDSGVAIIVSALIFAGIHVISPTFSALLGWISNANEFSLVFKELLYIIVYLAPAFVLSFVYSMSEKNLLPCILMHMAQNLLSVIVMFLDL